MMVVVIVISSITLPGCIGEFALTRNLHEWNSSLSRSRIVNELVFVGTIWIYPLFATLDIFIFNSIEFWEGTNPVTTIGEGENSRSFIMREGKRIALMVIPPHAL